MSRTSKMIQNHVWSCFSSCKAPLDGVGFGCSGDAVVAPTVVVLSCVVVDSVVVAACGIGGCTGCGIGCETGCRGGGGGVGGGGEVVEVAAGSSFGAKWLVVGCSTFGIVDEVGWNIDLTI